MVRWTTCLSNLTSWRAKNRSKQTRIISGREISRDSLRVYAKAQCETLGEAHRCHRAVYALQMWAIIAR